MPDIIKLLPDSVANQIAAGEVIQRPASAVKEILENALDAGADQIILNIKDAGKTLIECIDNGCGMSETDARMSFERHATSKISKAEDLFQIRTMGFRGEAMASIAAIAQVTIKTKQKNAELGTKITIDGSQLKEQAPCQAKPGTIISIKNLFFNVPARRNFLKSDKTEINLIKEEFIRVAIPNNHIEFKLIINEREIYHLPVSNLKIRLNHLFGNKINERIVPISETTELIKIDGFIGKPSFAKKTKGEQYFFVNKRYMRHPYFNHAIVNAYEKLIEDNAIPSYFLFFNIDPKVIDINIHPTKTEVKFMNEKMIYSILKASAKHALGSHNLTPSLDFEAEPAFDHIHFDKNKPLVNPEIKSNPDFNPFKQNISDRFPRKKEQHKWNEFISPPLETPYKQEEKTKKSDFRSSANDHTNENSLFYHFHNRFILTQVKSGLMIIHQKRAMERIYYEFFLERIMNNKIPTQYSLIPIRISLNKKDLSLAKELNQELSNFGFDIVEYEDNEMVINGIPELLKDLNPEEIIERMLENYKNQVPDPKISIGIRLAISLAAAPRLPKKTLQQQEMLSVFNRLFACKVPEHSPTGKPTFTIKQVNEIDRWFASKS